MAHPGVERVDELVSRGQAVLLDGGTATEVSQAHESDGTLDDALWGSRALVESPEAVVDVHRRYARAGCDVVSTNTWGLATALREGGPRLWQVTHSVHWMDLARAGVRFAREAIAEEGRAGECAVAFSLNQDLDGDDAGETVRLLSRAFADDPPDLILFETLSVVGPSLYATIAALIDTGLPVWLSFRRCREGLCGVFGQHWGGPEGDAFGRAAHKFEQMGAQALLVNCIPPDHVSGMVSYLRDFTDLPLGAYPNLGYYTSEGWHFEHGVKGEEYALMAAGWRAEGAQIIGGCCGVGAEHIEATRRSIEDVGADGHSERDTILLPPAPPGRETVAWNDHHGKDLYPLDFPSLVCDPSVPAPDPASMMAWKFLYEERVGARQRCLDVGSGSGILTVQLALNGAAHVRAIDIDAQAVENTHTNAFRNGVADRVSAGKADLYPWLPKERYEVIVASLDQHPIEPLEQVSTRRPVDYWGRGLLDQLITKLPDALAPEGVAYLVHLSILSRRRTSALLDSAGLEARVADYAVIPFTPRDDKALPQTARVEELSDAFHMSVGEQQAMVCYLLEIRHRDHALEEWPTNGDDPLGDDPLGDDLLGEGPPGGGPPGHGPAGL